jgi:hypothetical protein
MTLTKWDADLIDGLDELDVGVDVEMEGVYLPLEGGTLTGELTVDANLILEGAITKGDCVLEEFANSEFTLQGPDDSEATTWPQIEYILSPSRGKMQHLTVKTASGKRFSGKNSLFVIAPDQSDSIDKGSDPDYFFEDGQSMTIRIEVEDLNRHKADRYQCLNRWHDDIWWVNTAGGLAPDLNETGAMTINLWKAKGIVYGQLAGNYVKEREYHPDAFDFSKLKRVDGKYKGPHARWMGDEYDYQLPNPFVWGAEGGIQYRQGTTFARTSRDGRHFFIGQSGSDGYFDPEHPDHNNKLYPGELRVFGNNIGGSSFFTVNSAAGDSPVPQPFSLHYDGKPHATKPSTDSQLFGTATDMRLRVDKGTGVDFNPDGTKMFQSVACYHDPSLKDKYENVIGAHHLADPWDVGTTDFLIQEKLNDIIYCDEKYSEVRALHPDMKVCCLTFRPDGMGFYFAYVVYSLTTEDLEYYFVQQDLEEPWELSSAKDDYKYSAKFSQPKPPLKMNMKRAYPTKTSIWQINGITVSQNGRFIHAVYPHNYMIPPNEKLQNGLVKPRQFEMTTPWDISTAGNIYVGVSNGASGTGTLAGQGYHMGYTQNEPTHAVYWNDSGESCYFSYVVEATKEHLWYLEYDPLASFYKQNRFGFIDE